MEEKNKYKENTKYINAINEYKRNNGKKYIEKNI